jgi:NAD(P)H-flavin reductase/ferredoxin
MSKLCTVSLNGEKFSAPRGELLLDAALTRGVDIPHDCRSGHCGTCRARVVKGRLLGGQCDELSVVHACQARLIDDVTIETDTIPQILSTVGRVSALAQLTRDIIEVAITPARPVCYLPGQYFKVRFRGFPSRCFSPTITLDAKDDGTIRLHIRQVPNGRVSSALGRTIKANHHVKLDGPFGSAYLRKETNNRLVLIAGGTGFAPIWAIAVAALKESPNREIVVIVGVHSINDLYMSPALCWLARYPQVKVIPVTDVTQTITPVIHTGRPTDYVPPLNDQDVVYACGVPPMVSASQRLAAAAGARCYADAFTPSDHKDGQLRRMMTWALSLHTKMRGFERQEPELFARALSRSSSALS